MKLLAQTRLGNITGVGPLGNEITQSSEWQLRFSGIISNIIGVLTLVGALWFMFRIITAAIAWISAGGDKNAVEGSKQKITHAIIGLLIVVMSYGLIGVIGAFLGLDIINLDQLLQGLSPK